MKLALIGKSLSHSFSKAYFEDKFLTFGFDTNSYENLEYESEDDFLKNFDLIKQNFDGVNITIPYKETLISKLDFIDQHAQAIGAINCIKFKQDKAFGYNTDYLGFIYSIESYTIDTSKSALIIGNGGASKAVKYALESMMNIHCHTICRKEGDIDWSEIETLDLSQYSVIVQTTPLGMFPNMIEYPLMNYHSIVKQTLCVDLIYNPEKTLFLAHCEQNGAQILNGYPMLIHQADLSWDIWNTQD